MDYVVVHHGMAAEGVPHVSAWAAGREREGWAGMAVADHLHVGGAGWMHPFVTLGLMSAATSRTLLTTVFANNMLRSPVDLAHAALTVHVASAGRRQVGIGAGWLQDEVLGAGLPYPAPPERARRFREAVEVVRALLAGATTFHGAHYHIDLPAAGPACADPPRVSAALGGPWTLRHIGPLVDHIEVFPAAGAVRAGTADFAQLARVTDRDVHAMIDAARAANASATIGLSVFAAVGDGPVTDYFADAFAGGALEGLAGSGQRVAAALRGLDRFGLDRITVVPPRPRRTRAHRPTLAHGLSLNGSGRTRSRAAFPHAGSVPSARDG